MNGAEPVPPERTARDAITGAADHAGRRRGRGEPPVVPDAEFGSYYGRPVLKAPTWSIVDIGGYLFLGGLAGASSVLAAGAQLTGRDRLALTAKTGAVGAVTGSLLALIHDLGRPARFLNMLRVFKTSSPMSVGSWLLAGYGPLAGAAAASAWTGRLPTLGTVATAGAAMLGPAVTSYTAVLVSDTAVPAWHAGYRQLPFVFAGSAATAAGGLGLLGAPTEQSAPAGNLALFGVGTELVAGQLLERHSGIAGETFSTGAAGKLMRTAKTLSALGGLGAVFGRRCRGVGALSGAALLTASALTRLAVFHAGQDSAKDPKYTVVPQRQRLRDSGAPAD